MSAPPGTTNPGPSNVNTFVLGGAIAGLVVLCGGLLTNSLITLNIVTRHPDYAFRPGATQRTVDKERDPGRDTGPGVDDEDRGPVMAAQAFMEDLKKRDFGRAWERGTSLFKSDESKDQFRKRLQADKVFMQHNSYVVRRSGDAKTGLSKYDVDFKGPGIEGRYFLDVRQEDGGWRIDKFSPDKE